MEIFEEVHIQCYVDIKEETASIINSSVSISILLSSQELWKRLQLRNET